MQRSAWVDKYGRYFGTNGYLKPPWRIYDVFLGAIRRPGSIVEFGCGNGLLLRYVADLADFELSAYGFDLREFAIREAQQKVFPERANCFTVADMRQTLPFNQGFDYVLVNPLYADPGYSEQVGGKIVRLHFDGQMKALVERAWETVNAGGQLILWCYDGHVAEVGPQLAEFRRLIDSIGVGFTERGTTPVVLWTSAAKKEAVNGRGEAC